MLANRGLLAFALLLVAFAGEAFAQTVFVPAPNRKDMAYDVVREVMYIADGRRVLRYKPATGTFLAPFDFGANAQLHGIDISPDGWTLAIADGASSGTHLWVDFVDLGTGNVRRRFFPKAFSEAGTFSVAYAADGALLISSSFNGSGWVPLRRLDRAGKATVLAEVRQDTMLSASGDRKTIAFAESNISDGRWGLYDVPTRQLVRREWYQDGTSWFNYEIATDRFGSQFGIPTYGGAYMYDVNYKLRKKIGIYAGQQPIGIAYHPVENEIYFPWAQTPQVRIYDAVTLVWKKTINFTSTFESTGNWAYQNGRTRVSADGSLLMVTVPGGVRYVRMYAPLNAVPLSATTAPATAVSVQLQGSIGNGAALRYALGTLPSHGTVTLNGTTATYHPAPGFTGTDSFNYRVQYGEAVKAAKVTVTVE